MIYHNDPTLEVLRTRAMATLNTVLSDIEDKNGRMTIKAILSKLTHESNAGLSCPDPQQFKQSMHEIVDQAPCSMSMVFLFAAITELAAYLDPSLRKDDTDERKHVSYFTRPED